ncbi:MAG: PHP domain-containing protein [Clostridia bacterium]|nr:PHP domain-containing protein [Clostridia bacterium]
MYKTEPHLHTRPVSFCAYYPPEEMIEYHSKQGYDTVFVSDHFAINHFARLGDISWSEKIRILFDSYLRAKKRGEELGMNVLFSPELTLCGNHFLLYNVDLDFLNSRDDFFYMSLEEFHAYAQENGVLMIQAHPLRDGKCTPKPDCVIGFEVINTNPRHNNFDKEMLETARKHPSLLRTVGSDAHYIDDVGRSAVLSPYEIKTVSQYLELLRSGEAKFMVNGEIVSLE